jgi:hypothetical protein
MKLIFKFLNLLEERNLKKKKNNKKKMYARLNQVKNNDPQHLLSNALLYGKSKEIYLSFFFVE